MIEESPLVREMFENDGQLDFPGNGQILVYVSQKNEKFPLDKTLFDFFVNGDMMNHSAQSDEIILFYNYVAQEWKNLAGA